MDCYSIIIILVEATFPIHWLLIYKSIQLNEIMRINQRIIITLIIEFSFICSISIDLQLKSFKTELVELGTIVK